MTIISICIQLLHSLGFSHEHQRPDRDDFITVDLSIVPNGIRNQYTKLDRYFPHPFENLRMPYDFNSIMHYDSFSNEYFKKPIIMSNNKEKINVNKKMSPIDVAKLNQLYPFKENSIAKNTCAILKNENAKLTREKSILISKNQKCQADHKALVESCDQPRTFMSPNLPQDNPGWSSWSSYSECTVSCGLGIQYRTRTCRPVYNRELNKMIACDGDSYEYQTCYDRECQAKYDTRLIQCEEYGKTIKTSLFPFEVPSNSPNQCLLYCKDRKGKVFNTSQYVRNGTPCRDGHACILNECRRVGCDHRINSTKKLNKCGICGGRDSQCHRVVKAKSIQSPVAQSKLTICCNKSINNYLYFKEWYILS